MTEETLSGFRKYLEGLGLSPRSQAEYYSAARLFVRIHGLPEDEQTNKSLADFVLERESVHYRYAMKAFLMFVGKSNVYEAFVKENRSRLRQHKKRSVKIHKVLTVAQVRQLVERLPEPYNIVTALQFDTGARASAILGLMSDNIGHDNDGDSFIQVIEKGSQPRTLYISAHVAGILKAYIESKDFKPVEVFWYIGKSVYRRYRSYSEHLRAVSQDALGFEISTHTLRRSRAIYYLRQGYDVATVQQALGHKSILTTSIYIKEAGISSKILMKKEGQIWGAD